MPPTPRDVFRDRLGTYFIGVAIGCTLLGMMWMARQQAAARDEAARAAAARATAAHAEASQATAPTTDK